MGQLSEGQKLWWVPLSRRGHQKPCEVAVTKVGRKWAKLENGERINNDSLIVDSGGNASMARYFLSREAYDQLVALHQAWARLKGDLEYTRVPEGVTVENIAAARKLLGLE